MRTAHDELSARLHHAPHFLHSRATLFRRDVLDYLDTRHLVEGLVGEGQRGPVALMKLGVGDVAPRGLDCRVVYVNPRQLEMRIAARDGAKQLADVASEVEETGARRVDPGEAIHRIQRHSRKADLAGIIARFAALMGDPRE